jgi:hypothetical protein
MFSPCLWAKRLSAGHLGSFASFALKLGVFQFGNPIRSLVSELWARAVNPDRTQTGLFNLSTFQRRARARSSPSSAPRRGVKFTCSDLGSSRYRLDPDQNNITDYRRSIEEGGRGSVTSHRGVFLPVTERVRICSGTRNNGEAG